MKCPLHAFIVLLIHLVVNPVNTFITSTSIVRYQFHCPQDTLIADGTCKVKKYPKYGHCGAYWQCTEDCSHVSVPCVDDMDFSYYDQECRPKQEGKCRSYGFHCPIAKEPMTLQCPPELVIGIRRATAGTNALGCTGHNHCCLPGGVHLGGCRSWVPRKDPRLFEHKKRCDGHTKCSVRMINYADCKNPMTNITSRYTPDFQLVFFSCITTPGHVAQACGRKDFGMRLNLKCPEGTLIQIIRAVVGLTNPASNCSKDACCPEQSVDVYEMDTATQGRCLSDLVFWCDGLSDCYFTGPVGKNCTPYESLDFQYVFYECIDENLLYGTNISSRADKIFTGTMGEDSKSEIALLIAAIAAGLILLILSIIVPIAYYMTPEKVILKSSVYPNLEDPNYNPPDVGFNHEESDGMEYDETPVTWNSLAYTDTLEKFDGEIVTKQVQKNGVMESVIQKFKYEKNPYEYHDYPSTSEDEDGLLQRKKFMASWASLAKTEIENLENRDDDLESIDYDSCSTHHSFDDKDMDLEVATSNQTREKEASPPGPCPNWDK